MVAQLGAAEAVCEKPKEDEGVPQSVHARIGKAQPGGALAGGLDRAVDLLEGVLGEDAIMAEPLHFEQPAVRRKADFAQLGQVAQTLADGEVVGVVYGGFGTPGA